MSGKKNDVTVIIVSWNNEAIIKDCITSVLNQNYEGIEIIVVDNNSADNGVELISKEFSQVKLIANKENQGFAKANNQAIRQSQGKYVLLLNPDVIMSPSSLKRMVSFMETHQDTGVCGCKILNKVGQLMWSCGHFPTLVSEFFELALLSRFFPGNRLTGKYLMSYWDHESVKEVDWLTGACLLASRKVIQEADLLNESYFLYSEDMDLCFQIKKNGHKIFYIPDVSVMHHQGASSNQDYERNYAQIYKSRYVFFSNNFGPLQAFLLRIIVIIGFIIRLILGTLFLWILNDKKKYLRKIKSFFAVLKISFLFK